MEGKNNFWRNIILFLPLLFYVMGINPFLSPSSYDDVTYWEGANSLFYHHNYMINEEPIIDWPPGTSLLFSLPLLFGLKSFVWVKIVVVICVFFSALLAWKLLEKEKFPHAYISVFFFLLLPSSFLWGTRAMSEWPFTLWSLLFLFLLDKLRKSFLWMLLAALVLLMAIITRYVGFALYFVLVFQAFKNTSWRGVFKTREFFTGLIALVVFASTWMVRTMSLQGQTLETSAYARGLSNFEDVRFLEVFHMIPKLFLGTIIYEHLPVTAALLCDFIVVFMLVWGWITLVRRRGWNPIDIYMLVTLVLVASWANGKCHRYLIPTAPFLLSYLFFGSEIVMKRFFSSVVYLRLRNSILVSAALFLIFLNSIILFYGNGISYGAAFYFLNHSPEKFYKGYWKELYEACLVIKNQNIPGKILLENTGDYRYVYFFTRHKVLLKEENEPPVFILVKKGDVEHNKENGLKSNYEKIKIPQNFQLLWDGQYVTVYQK